MIIHHSDLSRVTSLPPKYETPLIIDADRIKTSPFALERFKSIARRDTQTPAPMHHADTVRCVAQVASAPVENFSFPIQACELARNS
jgi:hypothetical protein